MILRFCSYICIAQYCVSIILNDRDRIMFSNIYIKNYRGLRNAEFHKLSQINLLFGKNNCGKSSVLESIFLISGQSNPVLPVTVNNMRGISSFSEQAMAIDFYGSNPENKISIIAEGDVRRELTVEMIRPDSHDVSLESLHSGKSDEALLDYGLKSHYKLNGNNTQYNSEIKLSKKDSSKGRVGIDKRYKETLLSQFIPSGFLQIPITDKFANIVKNKQEGEILETLRIIEPRIKDIQLVGQEIMVDIGMSQRLPINVLGDGIRKLLYIIVLIFESANGILLIDEIDNGLHFSVMKKLWSTIFSAAIKNNVQLFISTHSVDMIKGLADCLSEEHQKENRERVAAYKLIRQENDEVVSLRYDYESLAYSINQEMEMR